MSKAGETPETKAAPIAKSRPENGAGDIFAWARKEPADEGAWDAIDETARETDSPHEAEALYVDVLQQGLDNETLAIVGRRAIAFLEEWHEDTRRAVQILEQLITRDPENSWAFEKLSLLLTLAERWNDLLSTYDRALERLEDPGSKMHLLEEAARIAKDFAGQAQRASDYLKQLLLLRPADDKLAHSLERRLEQQERYSDLVDIWRSRLGVTEGAERLALRVRIGNTLLDQLRDAPNALIVAKGLLRDELGQDDACQLLERLSVDATIDVVPRREALTVLKERYTATEKLDDVVRVLRAALELAPDDAVRIELNQELVGALLSLDFLEDAQDACAAWLRLAPDDSSAIEQLRQLVVSTKAYAPFAQALVDASEAILEGASLAEATSGPSLRIQLLLEAANTQEANAHDPQAATDLFVRVLLDGDSDRPSRLHSARRLTKLLISPAQGGQRLDVLEKLSLLEPEEETQVMVLGEAAELAEKLGDPDRALGLWDRRLEKHQSDLDALDAKVRILANNHRYETLERTLRARVTHTEDADQRRRDLVWIATVFEEHLSAPEQGIETWKEVEERFTRDPETVDALSRLYTRVERWTELVEFLLAAVDEETDPTRKTRIYTTLGDVFQTQRHSSVDAVQYYRKALQIEPTHQDARSGLTTLLEKEDARHMAAETLATAYTAADEWQQLLAIVEIRFSAEPAAEARQALLLEAAEVLEARAKNLQEALSFVTRAFAIIPTADVEQRMLELAGQTRQWDVAVAGYQQALLGCDDLGRTTELLYEQGRLLETELARLDDALSAYRRILELDHHHTAAASSLIRCAGAIDSWVDAAWGLAQSCIANGTVVEEVANSFAQAADQQRAWERALDAARSEIDGRETVSAATGHDVRFQLAVWYRDRLGDFDVAELLLRRAVEQQRATGSLTALADIQRRHPDRDFVDTLLKLAEIHEVPLPFLDEAARVALQQVGDPVLARPILGKALDLADSIIAETGAAQEREIALYALEELLKLAREGSDYRTAFELLMRGTGLNLEPQTLLNLKHRAAETAAHELGNPGRAIELAKEVLEVEPGRGSTINLLAMLYEQEALHEELLALRERELALAPPIDRRLELRLDMARVMGIVGGGVEERVTVLRENLGERLGHAESIDVLAEMLAPLGHFTQLYELLCEQADALSETGASIEASVLYARAGLLAEETLDDIDGAIAAYRKATELAPDVEVLDSLASIHSARAEFDEAVDCLLQRLELTKESELEARRAALVRLGNALKSADRVGEAIKHLSRGVEKDPPAQTVRELLVALHEENEHWGEFAQLLAEGVPYVAEEATKVDYLSRSADALWRRLNDLPRAIPLLEKARDLKPEDQQLRLVLADALRQAQRYDEARELLEGLLAEFGRRRTQERATVHFQLALIARATQQLDEALSELEAASAIVRSDPVVLKTLGDVAHEKGELERAERAYRALLLLVGRGQSAESGIGESAILFELYRLAVERNDEERATDLLDSAIEAADQNPKEALRLEAALREAGQWGLLLDAIERRGRRTEDEKEARAIQRARAEALVHLGRLDEALELRMQLLDAAPADAALLDSLEELAARCGKQEALAAKQEALAEQYQEQQPELSCELWLRLGRRAEANADFAAAARLYERAQATGRRRSEVLQALCQVHDRDGDTVGLLKALARFVEAEPDEVDADEQTRALFRLAELELREPKLRKSGLKRLELALEREPNSARAAQILLGAIEATEPTKATLTALENVARDLNDDSLLLRTLSYAVRREDTTLAQLQEAVHLAQRVGDEEQGLAFLERTVEVARANGVLGEVQWALSRLAEEREQSTDFEGAIALLHDAIEHAEPSDRFELELRLARVARVGARDLPLAAEVYERLAAEEPSDARAWKPLLEIYRDTRQTDKLEACLSRAEQHVVHDEQRRALQLERIRLLVDSDRIDEAESALREALEEAPDNDEACDLLLALLERQGKPTDIRELLSSRLDAAINRGDNARTTNYALRLGRLLEQEDTDAAIQLYQTARNAAPGSRDILTALLRLTPENESRDRADLMESLLPTEPEGGVEPLALELARLRLSAADEPGIERAFELGFKLNPRSGTLRERLEAWYRERDDWQPLAELLALDAATRNDPEQAIEQYKQAASIYETQLGDASAAADVLSKALELSPTSLDLLEPLSQYLLISAQGDRALRILSDVLANEQLDDETKPLVLHLRAAVRGRMFENNLQGLQAAIADLDAARAGGGSEIEADLAELLLRLRDVAESQGNQESERAATLRLARLLPSLQRTEEALNVLSSFSERTEEDADAAIALAELALATADWRRSMDAHRRLFHLSNGQARVEAALRFAEACEHCDAPMEARELLEEIHREVPGNSDISRRLYRMYEAAGANAELAELLLSEAANCPDNERKYNLLTDAAELLLKDNTQSDRAVEGLETALALVPNDHRATVLLSKAYGINQRVEEACAILEAAIKGHGKRRSRELSDLQHAMSVVAAAAGDDEGRFAWLEAALQSDRKNGIVASELAVLAQQRGLYDEAVKALQLITLLKEDCPMTRAEAYYRQALIARDRDDRKRAVLLAKRALSADAEWELARELLQEMGEA